MTETLEHYRDADEDRVRVTAPHETLGRIDVSGLEPVDKVDVHCSDADWLRGSGLETDHLYAWHLDTDRLELPDARIGRATLRDVSSGSPLLLRRLEAETLDITDADAPYTDLSEAEIGTLRLGGGNGRLDLRGTTITEVQGDLTSYHVVMDEDTYLHDVPEELASDLGYREVSAAEAWVLNAAENYNDGFTFEDLQRDYKSAISHAGTLGPLVQRDFLARDGDRFRMTPRGRAAAYHSRDEL